MFDTFNIQDLNIVCPGCNRPELDLQTKDQDCSLNVYNFGDTVTDSPIPVRAYTWCGQCDFMWSINIILDRQGKWIGYSAPEIWGKE
jgi:hypothetical protein